MAMEQPNVNQGYLNRLEKPTDMPKVPWVQWRVENIDELAEWIERHVATPFNVPVRFLPALGHQIVLQTDIVNSDLQLSPGDCLVLHEHNGRPRLGIVRARNSVPFREADGLRDHNNKRFMDPRDKKISHST